MTPVLIAALALFGPPLDPAPETPPVLRRVAVLGASLSDGFLLPLEADCMPTAAEILEAALEPPLPPPLRRTSSLFFLRPELTGRAYVDRAVSFRPTLVVALDFLFWYGYGFASGPEERLQRLERGLAQLDRLACPIAVGDLPDVSRAATRGVGLHGRPMILPAQVPAPDTLAAMNERIRRFALRRRNVVVVPLSRIAAELERGATIRLGGVELGNERELLDRDLLHPTLRGTIGVVLLALDELAKRGFVRPEWIVGDPDEVRRRLLDRYDTIRRQRGAAS